MDFKNLKTFFMWCTIINGVLLVLAVFIGIVGRDLICNVHGTLFQISRESLNVSYYLFLGIYKIVWLVFNAVPYIVLLIMKKE